jgi:hypothetical protein
MRTAWVIKLADFKAWEDRVQQQQQLAREAQAAEPLGLGAIALIMIPVVIIGLIAFRFYLAAEERAAVAAYVARTASKQVAVVATNNTASKVREIEKALQRMNVYDINNDGAVNCQDYVAAFNRVYRDAQIMYNPAIGPAGHVFNRVLSDDGWIYVEPQGQKDGVWPMKSVWPQWESVRHLNQEVTREYAK